VVEVRRLRACQRMMVIALLALGVSGIAHAQDRQPAATGVLTLQEALMLARARSEQLAIARAGVTRAESGELRARSERLPQLSFSGSYDRALASEFEGLFDNIDLGGGSSTPGETPDLSNLPFGRENTYRVGLTFSQNLFAGGRIRAQEEQARLARSTATIGLATTTAQLELDVARAFYDAALSDRLVSIAEATYGQANQTFELTRAQREAGRQSEFEQLRAQVARDTLQPQVIRQRANRDVAYMRLKQLLELPMERNIRLAAELENDLLPPDPAFAPTLVQVESGPLPRRLALDEARTAIESREAAVDVVRAQRWPSVALTSSYGRVAYPPGFGFPADFRTNWTVGVSGSIPILTGGRIKAEEMGARADLEESRSRLEQAQKIATLDEESTRTDLVAARAAWDATAGTVQQAQRAYEIAELRFREGLGTQLELSDSRVLLQQAEANRAQAARDYQLVRIRLALLPDLPLSAPLAGVPAAVPAQQPQAPPPPAQPRGPVQAQGGVVAGGGTGFGFQGAQ
jgi:outer membrane protein